jgi:hypothetical protein
MRARAEIPHPVVVLLAGVAFGFVVSGIGFTRYDATMAMFTFSEWRMFLAFAGAVALSMVAYRLLRAARPIVDRRFHRPALWRRLGRLRRLPQHRLRPARSGQAVGRLEPARHDRRQRPLRPPEPTLLAHRPRLLLTPLEERDTGPRPAACGTRSGCGVSPRLRPREGAPR